jgi:peptidoglycan/LPS O-acetylase OafA/YrhL
VNSPNIRYIPTVDHLRAFAATLIVFYHGMQLFGSYARTGAESFDGTWTFTKNPLLALVAEGHAAVSLFIVLSGFIFAYGAAGRTVSYRQFITNRLWRIAPMFFVLVLFGVHVYPSGFTFLALIQTLAFAGDLPGSVTAGPMLGITWAVAIEFRCYLIFPFLHRLVERHGLRYLVGVLAVTHLFRIVHYFAMNTARDIAYWTIVGRLDQFVIGMALAVFLHRLGPGRRRRSLRWLLPVAIAAPLAWLTWFNANGGWPADKSNRLLWPSCEGAVWALLIGSYVAFDRGTGRPGNWLSAAVARVGQVSFSTYLLHFTVISVLVHKHWVPHLATNANANGLLVTLVLAWPLTVAISALTYNVIEKPFMGFRRRYLSSAETAPAAAAPETAP